MVAHNGIGLKAGGHLKAQTCHTAKSLYIA